MFQDIKILGIKFVSESIPTNKVRLRNICRSPLLRGLKARVCDYANAVLVACWTVVIHIHVKTRETFCLQLMNVLNVTYIDTIIQVVRFLCVLNSTDEKKAICPLEKLTFLV